MDQRIALMSAAAYKECQMQLRKIAERLIWQCCSSGPPYDPFQIAKHMGVDVDIGPMSGLDGYVEVTNGRYFAVISSLTNAKRQRFTLSHELGHVLFMRDAERGSPLPLIRYRVAGCPPGLHQDPVEESLCNLFASELLLPTAEVRAEVLASADPLSSILRLSNRFDVSLQAAAKRVIGILGKRKVGCALWKNGEGKLWPMPLWSEGITTTFRRQLTALENLIAQAVRKRAEIMLVFNSFGKSQSKAQVCVRPFGRKHSLLFVAATDWQRRFYPHQNTPFRQLRVKTSDQLTFFWQ